MKKKTVKITYNPEPEKFNGKKDSKYIIGCDPYDEYPHVYTIYCSKTMKEEFDKANKKK